MKFNCRNSHNYTSNVTPFLTELIASIINSTYYAINILSSSAYFYNSSASFFYFNSYSYFYLSSSDCLFTCSYTSSPHWNFSMYCLSCSMISKYSGLLLTPLNTGCSIISSAVILYTYTISHVPWSYPSLSSLATSL